VLLDDGDSFRDVLTRQVPVESRELSFVKLVTVDEYCVLPPFFFVYAMSECVMCRSRYTFKRKIGQMLALIAKVVFFFNVRDLLP